MSLSRTSVVLRWPRRRVTFSARNRPQRRRTQPERVRLSIGAIATAAVLATGLTSCGSEDSGDSEIVVDQTVTASAPARFEMDGLKGSFYYKAIEMGGGMSPSIQWRLDVTDGAGPKFLRADLELSHYGSVIDSYKDAAESWVENELLTEVQNWSVASYIPRNAPPRDGESMPSYISSETGTDFVFTLRNLEVSDRPSTPKSVVTTTSVAPTFDKSTPAGRFNELAAARSWAPPASFVSTNESNEFYREEPAEQPAASIQSLIRQVNEWGQNGYATSSPTQILSQWMADWNPEMLAIGIDMLGDSTIKNTYSRVKAGDIEYWFGNGTHTIGDGPNQIPPGTYTATAPTGDLIENGYWERTSPTGDILDNNFVTSAQQVTVTISPSDGQFTSKRIGTWKPVQ